ncbi:PREDICTED: uncharacterized protein LOC104801433 [Tarenaya hassleriana]|uniref:uncharacterized protein LOC104801433 n=1 Tax=Tarenaya hassleriana TaxID=28532 RepID=UPI00053C2D28|nr:PREDICTED: uncharacterized protein LOC104801433 [Tarenaya hassleriana]
MKNKAKALLKQIFTTLSSMAKAKSQAIKNKSNAFKTRVLMLSLVENKNLGLGSISNKIHSLLSHNEDQDQEHGDDSNKAIILYNAAPPCSSTSGAMDGHGHDDGDGKYPDLRHTLFDIEDEFRDLEEADGGGSIIEMVKNSKEGEGESFSLENEIDHVADLFISRFHKQIRLQKLLSFKRNQEMLNRNA